MFSAHSSVVFRVPRVWERELTPAQTGGKIHMTVENIEAGLIDFKMLAAQTQQKMTASYTKGQTLGTTRAKAKAVAKKALTKRK